MEGDGRKASMGIAILNRETISRYSSNAPIYPGCGNFILFAIKCQQRTYYVFYPAFLIGVMFREPQCLRSRPIDAVKFHVEDNHEDVSHNDWVIFI